VALDQAVADGLIPRNATRGIRLPRLSGETVNPPSADEANRLLEAASGDRPEVLYVLAVHDGLRLGELLALRWKDADLERGALKVRRTITHARDGWRVGETKSGKGRKVRLSRPAAAALGEHRRRQLERRRRLAGLWEERGLVFPNGFGGIINPANSATARSDGSRSAPGSPPPPASTT
jgi:integrase